MGKQVFFSLFASDAISNQPRPLHYLLITASPSTVKNLLPLAGEESGGRLKAQKLLQRLISTTLLALLALTHGAIAATVPGYTPGELSISPGGAANYSIPIAVPPGVAGMQPSLSLNYNSQGGNGLLGMGWSLGGLSAISRCPATIVQDGFKGGIKFDSNDRYCMDGQRLIAINGTVGAGGTEYRTEIDGFSRIISYGQAGSGPANWKVWTKSGQVIEYGNTVDSRIEAQGKADALFWAVNKISDAVGNYLTVSYFEDNANGENYPIQIDYANDTASIKFVYESRSDTKTRYVAGSKVSTTQRLIIIDTFYNLNLARTYQLSYESMFTAERSRLGTITECAAIGDCFPTMVISWTQENVSSGFKSSKNYTPPYHIAVDGISDMGARFVDLNGDGLMDFVFHRYMPGGTSQKGAYLNTGNGWESVPNYIPPYHIAADGHSDLGSRFIDLNSDGLVDFAFYRYMANGTKQQGAYLNTGNGWESAPNYTPPYHIAVDGISDMGARFVDLNGDGLMDFVFHRYMPGGTSQKGAYLNTGNGWESVPNYIPPYHIAADGHSDLGSRFVDLNGDGLMDFVFHRYMPGGTSQKGAYLNTAIHDLVSIIDDGLGSKTQLTFKPLTDASVYTKATTATYPELDLQAPLYVVTQVNTDNGQGGTHSTTYKYGGLKAHLKGRGLLGFAWMESTNQQTGIATKTEYRQEFPYTGQVSRTEQRKPTGELLGETTATFTQLTSHNGKVHFPYVNLSTNKSYDYGSGTLVTTITTSNSYDTFGNPTDITIATEQVPRGTYMDSSVHCNLFFWIERFS